MFVTWRLSGTLPQPPPGTGAIAGKEFILQDRQLDSTPFGPHWLKDPRIAVVVQTALLHGEQARRAYNLLAWAVMPNHVHVVMQPRQQLSEIPRWLKTATAARESSAAQFRAILAERILRPLDS